jgi:hypothetical protein
VILSNQGRCVHLVSGFPRVIGVRVTLPMDQVLEGSCSSVEAVINDVLDFVLRFSFYEVRGWPRVVGAMGRVFVIGGE